jgi:hypothetical protein
MTSALHALRLLLPLLLCAGTLSAQGEDARVVPRGMVGVRVAGEYLQYDSRLGGPLDGSLGAPFRVSLPASRFAPVDSTRAALGRFFTATRAPGESFALGPEDLAPGTLDVGIAAEMRSVPVSLEVGVARRLMVRATVPVERRAAEVTGVRLLGGGFGRNLAGDSLARLFQRLDPAFQGVARLRYLPLAGSRAGNELQARYRRAANDTITLPLPTFPLGGSQVDSLFVLSGLPPVPVRSAGGDYLLGDVEVAAKLQLVNTTGDSLSGRNGARLAVEGGVRLPTAQGVGLDSLAGVVSEAGHAGVAAALFGDLVRERFSVSAHARYTALAGREVERYTLLADSTGLFPAVGPARTVRRAPGGRLLVALTPRYRLTDEVSLAAHYAFARVGATAYEAAGDSLPPLAGLESTAARTGQLLGLGARYSTLDAYLAGQTPLPLEVSLLWRTTLFGSGGMEDAGVLRVEGRLLYPLRGRGR